MKKFLSALAVLSIIAASGPSFAEEKAEKVRQLTGEITAIDVQANTLSLKGLRGELTCATTAETRVKADKEAKTLADLKAGTKITVKYEEKEGKSTCVSIEIKGDEKQEEKK